ncbi:MULTISPECIES: Gfo/Idh/MocA family oxidoreductase [Arthrobacter]|uniref:Gfo/Idh/MocA family oxidoreductase n=2 Tax=Arthrobacter TaxID=1663 RepID=A0ABU9KJN1_9MICC|nr:Gfo/Idh/MocA family oxidoreductase [Arthrobacter sp. YJM1]MDP5227244.1 oxidoreductase [Arthrobacter sp. YJM1]
MTFTSYLGRSSAAGAVPQPALAPIGERGLRVLVRGTGSIGARHARVLGALGVERLYVWPVRAGLRLEDRPDLPPAATVVEGYPDGPLDLVIIATDTRRHAADTLEALAQAPGAILLEKPVAPAVEDSAVLRAHPGAHTVYVSAPLRFHQGFAVIDELLPRLGRVTSAQVTSQSWLPSWRPNRDFRESYSARHEDGGVLRDLVHDIDYPCLLFGAPSSLRACIGSGVLGIEAEESADLQWDGTAAVQLRLDYVSPVKTRGIRIATTEGALSWDVVSNRVVLEWPRPEDGTVAREEKVFPADADVDTALARQTLAVLQHTGLDAGDSMSRFRPASLADGITAVAVCDAARTAAASGGTEPVVW